MIPNKQCMKDILLYVSENTKVKVDDMSYHNITLSSLNISTLLDKMQKEGKYTIDEIAYNLIQCYHHRLVDVNISYKDSNTIQSATSNIFGITLTGIDFINQDQN